MNVEDHFLASQTLVTEEVTYSQDEDGNIMILQDGVTIGEVKVLRKFVNGQLDKKFVQDFLDDYDREIEDNTFRIGDSVCTKEMEDCGVITGVNGYKFIVTWAYGSGAECKTELCASDLIKC